MARPKLQFSEEQNFRIAQMVEINMTLDEMIKDLKKNFNVRVSIQTLATHIKSLGLERVDNRKYNSHKDKNRVNGYTKADVVGSKEKAPSKYKLKKYYNGDEVATIHDAKGVGYDKDDNPLYYTMVVGRDGNVEEVEIKINFDELGFTGGEGCVTGSKRWWMIERMKFELGDKLHPLFPGQKKGDWRGVVKRFTYDDDGYCRTKPMTPNEFMMLEQEAWERYVDARVNYVVKKEELTGKAKHDHNKYVINNLDDSELFELMSFGPDVIYKYIPPHLYGAVVLYCFNKMEEENRLIERDENIIEAVKKHMAHIRVLVSDYEADRISLDVIKKCLAIHPNDYDLVIKMCVANAIEMGLIKPNYTDSLIDKAYKIFFKSVEDPNSFNMCFDLDWFAANDNALHDAVYKKFEMLNSVCDKFGLVFGGGLKL